MARYGVLGAGVVAQVLAKGLAKHGHEVRIGNRTVAKLAAFSKETGIPAGTTAEVAAWAQQIVLAVAGHAAVAGLQLAGAANLAGKTVIDTTNPIAESPPVDGVLQFFTGPNDSLLERLQTAFPAAHLVKAFNSVGNAYFVDPSLPGGPPTMFYCGNDAGAKAEAKALIQQFGWEPADMGTATAARAIEPLCQLWCLPGLRENSWTHAFRLLRG